ncbi:lipase [Coprinopsis cinerea okayama7|uniref:Lipase n=1 Tax=Coprinopsis cinerea (strain Okayama-7 / 130 / ATCC MYA-4618 / FGSC 9003) TaxID=240176 RepID=A8N8N7_COPC7|nr:lipase [Coprinopsis cinerea okayama7\|eukprot:XP_001831193.1 lipase [Coprinopsis cinerea okayama7\
MALSLLVLPFSWTLLLLLALVSPRAGVLAVPLVHRQADLVALSNAEIQAFRPFTFYASTAYCKPDAVLSWSCGANCNANPTFKPIAAGGDGADVQFWYVGIDPTLQTIVVGHQGTDPTKIEALLTDADFFLDELESENFPGLDRSIKVHNGFAEAHAETAADVRAALQRAIDESGLTSVSLVGHSLGGALSLLDGVSLPLFFPDLTFRTIVYGMPRVGNKAFAEYVNRNVDLDRINNQDDFVPIIPGRFLGFQHAHGEKHIQDDLSWLVCPGNDSTDKRCATGDVRNIFDGSLSDHKGPYDTVLMGC